MFSAKYGLSGPTVLPISEFNELVRFLKEQVYI